MSSVVRCVGVRYRYPPAEDVLRGVSVTFQVGVTALLGPNGSGKSTLLSIVSGRLRTSGGLVERPPGSARFAAQRPELDPDMTVGEQLELFEALHGDGSNAVRGVEDVIALFGLEPVLEARVSTLSGGNKRRAHLAIAMLGRPSVLALDEPTSGLDQAALEALAEQLDSTEGIVVLATHDLAFATRVATRFVLMRPEGDLETEEDMSTLVKRYREEFATTSTGTVDRPGPGRGRGQGRRGEP